MGIVRNGCVWVRVNLVISFFTLPEQGRVSRKTEKHIHNPISEYDNERCSAHFPFISVSVYLPPRMF